MAILVGNMLDELLLIAVWVVIKCWMLVNYASKGMDVVPTGPPRNT
jgi:hypothetical protein